MIRNAKVLSLLVLGSLLFLGCNNSEKAKPETAGKTAEPTAGLKRIVLLNNTDSPFWDAARAGIDKAAADLGLAAKGFSAGMDTNDGTEQGQIEKLRQYGTQSDIVAVVISPTSATNPAIADELKNLKAKGIIIGCFDSDLDAKFLPNRDFYVGTDNEKGGKVLGTAAKNLKSGGGEYVQFVGLDSQLNARQRMDGFTASVGASFKQIARRTDDADRGRARDNVRQSLDQNPNLSILVGIWSYNAPAIVDVVKERKIRDKMTIVTFDAEQLAIQQMSDGMIDAMVVQNPFGMGYESVRYCFAKLNKDEKTLKEMFPKMGTPGGDILDTGLKVVVPDTGSALKAEMFQEYGSSVEFITMGKFQEWLKKYGLTSS